ncbi:MAG: MBL fold metallo-hydrolase [Clostridiales bacterium]|nr:MBL fold metallo-hydrolase [Clostridiales bacterium]
MTILRYGSTNTFFIPGSEGGLLVDTDYAGSLNAFYRAIKQNGLTLNDLNCVMATHWHPDHMGLIGELTRRGVRLLLPDTQREYVHFSDAIFAKDGLPFNPVNETEAQLISCEESRAFLSRMGISGEIISTPSHSADSVSLVLDDGDCCVGDLEPPEYIAAYGESSSLSRDWERLLAFTPKRVFFGHAPERILAK